MQSKKLHNTSLVWNFSFVRGSEQNQEASDLSFYILMVFILLWDMFLARTLTSGVFRPGNGDRMPEYEGSKPNTGVFRIISGGA